MAKVDMGFTNPGKKNPSSRAKKETNLVMAAGAVVYRRVESAAGDGESGSDAGDPRVEVALVHRNRYNDWSLPKGKVDPGEALPVTAVREILEETGYECRLHYMLGSAGYPLKENARKEVTYWAAEALGGEFVTNGEVDELRWLSVPEARDLTSYQLDRKLLDQFATKPVVTSSLMLVRHARAGDRQKWVGDDDLRPIDKTGRIQAEMLVPLLGAFGVNAIHSAPLVRCEQTVTPLADETGLEIVREPALSDEGFATDPDRAVERLVELATSTEEPAVVSSQGSAIPGIIQALADEAGIDVGDTSTKKGGTWYLGFYGSRLGVADLMQTPLPLK